MARTLIPVYGVTDGSSTTGIFSLVSPMFTNTPDYLRFDKGLKVKIWATLLSGQPVVVNVEYTEDVTTGAPIWATIGSFDLSAEGMEDIEQKVRPMKIDIKTGNEAIRFTWSQSTAAVSHVMLKIEVTDEIEDGE